MPTDRHLDADLAFSAHRSGAGTADGGSSHRPAAPPGWYDVRELWYRLLARRPWSCLVVISPDRTADTLRVVRSLAELGTQHYRRPVEAIDALDLDVDRAASVAHKLEAEEGSSRPAEPRFVIALESPFVNPIAFRVLAAADAVLVVLEKGVTRIPDVRRITEAVGPERLIGAVLTVKP